jgi:hypothetical protein
MKETRCRENQSDGFQAPRQGVYPSAKMIVKVLQGRHTLTLSATADIFRKVTSEISRVTNLKTAMEPTLCRTLLEPISCPGGQLRLHASINAQGDRRTTTYRAHSFLQYLDASFYENSSCAGCCNKSRIELLGGTPHSRAVTSRSCF